MIPADAEKPIDPRKEKGLAGRLVSSDIDYMIESTSLPMPSHNPDSILQLVKDEKSRRQYEAELAYLRGDFELAMRCYQQTEGNNAARVRASLVGVAAAISRGDYHTYIEIESFLKRHIKNNTGSGFSMIAELALASVAVSVIAPKMVPDWLKDGDFSAFPPRTSLSYLLYLRARYFLCAARYEAALAVAETALTYSLRETGIKFPDVYLRVVCALACHRLGRADEAKRWLLKAMRVALPHGFITPFAEAVSDFGGIMEQCLKQTFSQYYDTVVEQWKRTVKNWITFHNQFTKDNITSMLSLREYHLAQLVARHVPYVKIAKQHDISVGRLKNIMLEIYEKLFISSRDELAKYVLLLK